MSVLGLIPARAGSQRCPGKNRADLGGKPLIVWTINAAHESGLFDTLVVSTDDPIITAIAAHHGCKVIERPSHLANANTLMLPVVEHAVETCKAEIITLLQPTSPFRTAEDIVSAHEIMTQSGGDAVVSVTEAPEDLVFEIGHASRMRQSKRLFVPNGAIYIITADQLARKGDWYSGISFAYQMPKDRSLDIDTEFDLEMARMIVNRQQAAA